MSRSGSTRSRGTGRSIDEGPSPERVVARATSAARDVEAAASFLEDGGLVILRVAIERADRATARRGRRALAAFEWIRWAANADADASDDTSSRSGRHDHFHSGHGIHLRKTGERLR